MPNDYNSAIEKAKLALDVVVSTTEKAIVVSKKKISVTSSEIKLNKSYERLGKAYFDSLNNSEYANIDEAVEDVKKHIELLKLAKDDLANEKDMILCKYCGKEVEVGSLFCSYCGKEL